MAVIAGDRRSFSRRWGHDRLAQAPWLVGSTIDQVAPSGQRAVNTSIDVIDKHKRHRR